MNSDDIKPDTKSFDVQTFLDDPETFAKNTALWLEEAGKAAAAYLQPIEKRGAESDSVDRLTDFYKTLGQVGQFWLEKPERAMEAQTKLVGQYMELWTSSMKRMAGESTPATVEPETGDRRFQDEEWQSHQFFDFLKQVYLITANWAESLVEDADELEPHTKQKAAFYMKQVTNAISPSNFAATNPEVLRETLSQKGGNLVEGMRKLAEDIKAGDGSPRIRQSDTEKFVVGENIATTPGEVVYQNEICQLIQYSPTTDKVYKRPILIVPPWINKFYILDLNEQKSLVKWLVAQGHTVFIVSWINPDVEHAQLDWADYMKRGIYDTSDVIKKLCPRTKIHAVGYCVGGSLLSITLAHMATKGDKRFGSATFFTTQVDFTHAGDLLVFVDEEQVTSLEKVMQERGYLEAGRMATAFNLLRSNDLIWAYVINNYLKGKEPFPFDLLHWNSDSTRMTCANHSFYLRRLYLNNDITKGNITLDGVDIDLGKIDIPIYTLATKEDHIAPPKSVLLGSTFYGSDVEYVLSGSGHIAGVVNPPAKKKYGYWTDGERTDQKDDLDHWIETATPHEGSWWPHWNEWLLKLDDAQVAARTPGGKAFPPIEAAPGSYVKKKVVGAG